MSTIRATYVQHGSSAVPNITLNASGQVIVASGIVSSGTFAAPSGSVSAPGIYFNGDSNTGLYSPAADTIAFTEGGVEALRIDSSGRVGIGTSSPAQRLHVSGSNAGGFQVTNADNSDAISLFVRGGNPINSTTDNAVLHVGQRSDVSIITTGRVGIGTTSPSTSLHVSNASNAEIRLGSGSYDAYIGQDSAGVLAISQAQAGSIKLQTNGSERARIDSSGRLLVGTSTSVGASSARVQVKGASGGVAPFAKYSLVSANDEEAGGISLASSGSNSITLQADPDNLRASSDISFSVDGTERMRISSDGTTKFTAAAASTNLIQVVNDNATPTGIAIEANFGNATGTNTNTAYLYSGRSGGAQRFYVYGNGGIANYSANNSNLSDRNAKKDISPAAGTWDCIKEWEIVNYRYKDQPDDADLNLGVIAQQVAESCPEVITVFEEAKDDQPEKLGIKEQQMYWMAIKALQEAQVRIEALEAEVAALKTK